MAKSRYTASERFWSKVQAGNESECWPWTGAKIATGHGRFKVRSYKCIGTHRFAYIIAHGDIPTGMVVRHTCDNPACCNPRHLMLGEHSDNVADRVTRGRSATGERNGRAKLTRQQVEVIRQRRVSGETYSALGREYGVDPSTVRLAAIGHNW